MTVHLLLRRACEGELPGWARAGEARIRHMERVADLLEGWARTLSPGEGEVLRWRGVGMLHDVVRDEAPERLRALVSGRERELPDELLHGPAAAALLREEGVGDDEVLDAVRHHTTGHPGFRELGRCLYVADYVEPGRSFASERTGELRRRMPEERRAVLREVIRDRVGWTLERGLPLRPETTGFWNSTLEIEDG